MPPRLYEKIFMVLFWLFGLIAVMMGIFQAANPPFMTVWKQAVAITGLVTAMIALSLLVLGALVCLSVVTVVMVIVKFVRRNAPTV